MTKQEWEDFKARWAPLHAGFRESDEYRAQHAALILALSDLHPDSEKLASVIGRAIAQVARGTPVCDLDRATKTMIGPAIERGYLAAFDLPQLEETHKIDTRIGGVLIDIKTSINRYKWMLHVHSTVGKWCLVFHEDCAAAAFSLGILFVTADILGTPNGDSKSSILSAHRDKVTWLYEDVSMIMDAPSEVDVLREEIALLRTETIAMRETLQVMASQFGRFMTATIDLKQINLERKVDD